MQISLYSVSTDGAIHAVFVPWNYGLCSQPAHFTINENDTCLLLHTSGTTSRPKCVPLSHKNIKASIRNIVSTYSLTRADRTLVVMPLFHVHGLIGTLFSTLASGGCAVLMDKFSAKLFWPAFLKHGCTWYSAVPTIHSMLLKLD